MEFSGSSTGGGGADINWNSPLYLSQLAAGFPGTKCDYKRDHIARLTRLVCHG